MKTDFIVIGSGLAGLTSSLILSNYGKVLLVTKGKLSDGATNWAQGGVACVVEKNDTWQKHYKDTLVSGAYHNDRKSVEFLVKNAPSAIDWLEKMGVPFEKEEGHFKVGREGGHSYNRIIHATDFTGKEIEFTLLKKIRENKNIIIWEDSFAQKLLVERKKCFGVQIIKKDKIILCYSKFTILATGGLGQIYQWTTNPLVSTGDGYALAYRGGVKLKDMEFIQFHPTALKPASSAGRYGNSPLFLLTEALRGEDAYLVNSKGERFMGDYDKREELAPRDIVSRAIFEEQQKGYEIYLDIRHKRKQFLKKRFPNIYEELKKRGFDLVKHLIPVTPAAHFSCGGVETDLSGRTNIKNLFAFGEVACTGVHGANRLASNSLLEAVVFPLRLLRSARLFCAPPSSSTPLPPANSWYSGNSGRAQKASFPADFYLNIRKNLQKLMWEKVGIVRRKRDLEYAIGKLSSWEKDLEDLDYPSRELLELKNMILVGKLITQSALKRRKSLGTHFITV
ncbi:L-aspartate oxidase [Candidatus Gottesmanbacteria bacterium]|nr:L-aspartate oxidase [Candidatus Gottesmanbacteria bacterium]